MALDSGLWMKHECPGSDKYLWFYIQYDLIALMFKFNKKQVHVCVCACVSIILSISCARLSVNLRAHNIPKLIASVMAELSHTSIKRQ